MALTDRRRINVWPSDWTETADQTILTCQVAGHQAGIDWVYASYGRSSGTYRSRIGRAGRVMKCEKLSANIATQFRPPFDCISIDVSAEDTSCALEVSTIDSTLSAKDRRSTALKKKCSGGFRFARKYKVGEHARQFATELAAPLERQCQECRY